MVPEENCSSLNRQLNDWPDRWLHINRLLDRKSPLCNPGFVPISAIFDFVRNDAKILIIGAGGLGCELLKNIALLGFTQIDVIDMDTIDLSNLNRQFLFRSSDIGQSKAATAAKFINERIPGVNVVAHHAQIQDKDEDFYRSFRIVVCGLDSIVARRWINSMLISLLRYEDDGSLDESTIIPMVDGGTEGFKGNVRVILPGRTACIECTLDLYPEQVNFPLCTIAHTPRLPEHCIEYVRILLWPKESPFGQGVQIDTDDPAHITWIYEQSLTRAAEYSIEGVTYRLTQGVIKRIIPAVASTNAIIASASATEVFKLATTCFLNLNNYMVFSDINGVYTYTYEAEKNPDCLVCSFKPVKLSVSSNDKLSDILTLLKESPLYQMKSPGITTEYEDGRNRTLYMSSLENATKGNLSKTLLELGIKNEQSINVYDVTTPTALTFILEFNDSTQQ